MISCVIRYPKEICSVYCEKGGIFIRRLIDGVWGRADMIACGTKGEFSVVRDPSGVTAVLYRNRRGSIMLSGCDMRERLIADASDKNMNIAMIRNGNNLRLIYDRDYTDMHCIAEQHRSSDEWSHPCIIDSHEGGKSARLISLENNNIIFYIKRVPERQLGYREISANGIGSFKMVFATGYGIKDYSLALTAEELHICIVISAGRINRLVYVKRDMYGISKPLVIGEGVIHGCQMSLCRSKPTVIFSTPNGNNIISSYDNGYSFKTVSKGEFFKFGKIPLIDFTRRYADGFSATELVNCSDVPYDIKYCPFIKDIASR